MGNLYIADPGDYRVRKITPAGIITTIAGYWATSYSGDGGTATGARFAYPFGIAVDRFGTIYVADAGGNAIRLLTMPMDALLITSTTVPSGIVERITRPPSL